MPEKSLLIPEASQQLEQAIAYFRANYGVKLIFKEMFRTVKEQADEKNKGWKNCHAESPGFSGHNFGLCFDLDVDLVFYQFRGNQSKYSLRKLREDLVKFGFTHVSSEMWHFEFLSGHKSILEAIQHAFAEEWREKLTVTDVQSVLSSLGYYKQDVDGSWSPCLRLGLKLFQKDYCLYPNGQLDEVTNRLLVAATMQVIT